MEDVKFVHILILALGSLNSGIVLGFCSPTIQEISNDLNFNKFQISLYSSITMFSSMLGSLFISYFLDKYGRKKTLRFNSYIHILSWLVLIISNHSLKYLALIHRFVNGLSQGGIMTLTPMYISEISPTKKKAVYGSMHQFGISFGVFLVYFFGMFLNWKKLAIFGGCIAVIYSILNIHVPDSPVSNSFNIHVDVWALLQPNHFKSLLICLCLMLIQQLTGINALQSNLAGILKSKSGPVIASTAKIVAGLLCISTIGIFGRIRSWIISSVGCAISTGILAYFYYNNSQNFIAIVGAFGYLFSFCLGIGPIPWCVIPELFPDSIRSTAQSVSTASSGLFAFLVIFIFPYITDLLGLPLTMTFFSIFSILGCVFGYMFINRSIENDEEIMMQSDQIMINPTEDLSL